MDALFGSVVRYRPQQLKELATSTNFSRKEIQHIYRGFKQECPLGTVDEDSFKHLFSQFFPFGDASKYAQFVFDTVKSDNSRTIATFEEFLSSLSDISRGTRYQKLRWLFSLYDNDRDGRIDRSDLQQVVSAVHDMMGSFTIPPYQPQQLEMAIDDIFRRMDINGDGVITFDELEEWCTREGHNSSLEAFNTVW